MGQVEVVGPLYFLLLSGQAGHKFLPQWIALNLGANRKTEKLAKDGVIGQLLVEWLIAQLDQPFRKSYQ